MQKVRQVTRGQSGKSSSVTMKQLAVQLAAQTEIPYGTVRDTLIALANAIAGDNSDEIEFVIVDEANKIRTRKARS